MAKAGAVRAGRAYVEMFADNSSLIRGLKQADRALRNWGRKLQSIGGGLTKMGLAGAVPLGISAKMFASFEDGMLMVKAVTGATGAQFDKLSAKARQLGADTSYTASEVAGAMLELGRAGFSSDEIDKAISGMLNLARATGTELPLAANIAAATLRGFGLEAGEMDHVADVLVAAANNSAQTLEDLGESMKYVAPVSKAMGRSIEDTAIALGHLANAGIKGSMAGTSGRQMELALASEATQKTLRGIGVEALTAQGDVRDFADVMLELGSAIANMPNAERLSLMKDLFKQRAVTAAVVSTEAASERMVDAIRNAGGIAAKQAAEADSGLGGVWRRMTSAINELSLAVGSGLKPALSEIGEYIRGAAAGLAEFVAENSKLVMGVGLLTGGLLIAGPAITGIGTALIAAGATISGTVAGLGILGSAFAAIATPVGAAGAAVVGLGVAFATMTETGRGAVRDFSTDMGQTFDSLRKAISSATSGVAAAFTTGDISSAIAIMGKGMEVALGHIANKVWEWRDSVSLALQLPASKLADLERWMGVTGPMKTTDEREQAVAIEQAKRLNDIAAKEAELKEMVAKAEKTARLESAKRKLDELKAAAAVRTKTPETPPLDSLVGQWMKQGLTGIGELMGRGSNVAGDAIATLAKDMPGLADLLPAMQAREDLPELASQAAGDMGGEARGTFSSVAAARMGGILAVSPMERAARSAERTEKLQERSTKLLGDLATAAKSAKLVFAGQLPG